MEDENSARDDVYNKLKMNLDANICIGKRCTECQMHLGNRGILCKLSILSRLLKFKSKEELQVLLHEESLAENISIEISFETNYVTLSLTSKFRIFVSTIGMIPEELQTNVQSTKPKSKMDIEVSVFLPDERVVVIRLGKNTMIEIPGAMNLTPDEMKDIAELAQKY